jgi:oxygen-independent coproporphyrinogen-3 oxidase
MQALDYTPYFARIGADPLRDAFATRRAVMPWRGGRAVAADEMSAQWNRLLGDATCNESTIDSDRGRVVYLHVPFCANHCLFCGFYRNAHTADQATRYVDLLVAEIESEAEKPAIRSRPIAAVYFGGGTPSALSAADLARLLTTVRRSLPLTPDCEITIEGRIIHFDSEKIDACLDAGVNRISIGVQSFDTAVRTRQGRRSTREQVIGFLEDIRRRDRAALVIDLIFGLPGQTEEVWRDDLRICDAIDPDGVDLYGINIIPGTPLHTAIKGGKFPAAPTLTDLGAMYRAGTDFLTARGWRQISNSHWGRTARERNRYNLMVKAGAECLAYGSGAGGLLGRYSYGVNGDLAAYAADMSRSQKPIGTMRIGDDLQSARDYIAANLEIGMLDMTGLSVPGAPDAGTVFAPLLSQWHAAGILTMAGDTARLTTAGRFWYGNLIDAFNDILVKITGGSPPAFPMQRASTAAPGPDRISLIASEQAEHTRCGATRADIGRNYSKEV